MPDEFPITYKVGYHVKQNIGAHWSKTSRFVDASTVYEVVEYTEYAPNINKFIELYPTFTLETSGEAKSASTFGDVGSEHFGKREFPTNLFNSTNFRQKLLVSSYKNDLMFDVEAQIGIDLKRDDKNLYLRPFVSGWIYSVGARFRDLNLGFDLTKITFHPKQN